LDLHALGLFCGVEALHIQEIVRTNEAHVVLHTVIFDAVRSPVEKVCQATIYAVEKATPVSYLCVKVSVFIEIA